MNKNSIYQHKYFKTERGKKSLLKALNKYSKNLRIHIINHYGNKCYCCGETEIKFLTIDHLNNNGYEFRKKGIRGLAIYRWIIKNDFPKDINIACFNCNCGRAKNNGICPHKQSI